MIEIYVAANVADAELVCELLAREGIEAVVSSRDLSGIDAEAPAVFVLDEADDPYARRLIAAWMDRDKEA